MGGGEGDAWREGSGGDGALADVGAEGDEEGEDDGHDDEIEERDADDAEDAAHGNDDANHASFVFVQAWGDEEPELVDGPGRADDQGDDGGDADVGAEGFDGVGRDDVGGQAGALEGGLDRGDEEGEQVLSEDEGDDEDGGEAGESEKNSAAEVFEVLAERHGVRIEFGPDVLDDGVGHGVCCGCRERVATVLEVKRVGETSKGY
jgi:hypothetical protein